MYQCEHCGWRIYSSVRIKCPMCKTGALFAVPQNAWVIMHSRYADAIESGVWDPLAERKWLDVDFARLIPCQGCGSKWEAIAPSIDLSSAWHAFETSFAAHNRVSLEHVVPPKPALSWRDCKALYLQQPSMDDCCVAVTSLSTKRMQRHTECLNTWRRAGLTIFAVQTVDEVRELEPLFPQVATWCIQQDQGPPLINRLADVAATIQCPALIINADIEIRGDQSLIRDAIADGILVGVRHNYRDRWWIASPEEYGLDVFGVTAKFASSLPRLGLRIGRPMWDYWLPYHAKINDFHLAWIRKPLFYHRAHPLAWNQSDWNEGARIFCNEYKLDVTMNWEAYRHSM